ncbi:DUF4339 domain-containing protein [Microcoleus sp. MON2_D5]|uniref:DUF4339 domain-containing protein n=1 Tax=Microcoleus sp. MON2_D5 TaxID=2818833 RepID=UPI002FD18B8C
MNYSTKVSRRKVLLLLSGTLTAAAISLPSEAAKKGKRTRSDRYYPPRNRLRDSDDGTTPSPTPSPTPAAPEPYRPTSPVVMLGLGGGVLGVFGCLGAWAVKMNQKSTPPPTPAPAKRAKSVRQAVPEVADWYVFRSGKAEGPYTALQLWEVQKITARTKVKRGEADWQKAGEVSELAKYLSEK